jgi:hypothetical protein
METSLGPNKNGNSAYVPPPWKPPPKRYKTSTPPPDRKCYEVILNNFPTGVSERDIYDFVLDSVTFSGLVIGISREPSKIQVVLGGRNVVSKSQLTIRFISWTDTVLFLSHPKLTYKGRDVQSKKTKIAKKYDVMFPKSKRKRVTSMGMFSNLNEEACVYIVDETSLSLGKPSDLKVDSIMMALKECIGAPGYPRGHLVGAEKLQGLVVELRDPLHVVKAISLDATTIDGKLIVIRPWLDVENFHEKLRRIYHQIHGAPIAESDVKVEEL